eukprot:GEMP01039606.1.p1 GENE.GEMP01039606.1~~GEMP01039606.1.p1  ORF type:complete len:153 (+),score=24.75 GEMP01039606.1:119-577(+)
MCAMPSLSPTSTQDTATQETESIKLAKAAERIKNNKLSRLNVTRVRGFNKLGAADQAALCLAIATVRNTYLSEFEKIEFSAPEDVQEPIELAMAHEKGREIDRLHQYSRTLEKELEDKEARKQELLNEFQPLRKKFDAISRQVFDASRANQR